MENKKGSKKQKIVLVLLLLVVLCCGGVAGVTLYNQRQNAQVATEETNKKDETTEVTKVTSNTYTVMVKSDTGVVLPNVLVSIYDAEGNMITNPEATDAVGRLLYTPEGEGAFGASVLAAPYQYALDREIHYFETGENLLTIVLKEDPTAYVAKIGDMNYTLRGAIAAANASKEDVTITFLHDVYVVNTLNFNNKSGKTITVDGGGKKLTYLADATMFGVTQKQGTVNFQNMTVVHNGSGAAFRTSNAINLNLTDVNILAQNNTEGFYKWSLINLFGKGKTNLTMTRVNIDMDIDTIAEGASAAAVIRTGNEGNVKDIKITMNNCNIDATGAYGRAGIRVTPDTTANIVLNNTKFLTQNNYVIAVEGQLVWSQTNSTLGSLDKYYNEHPVPDVIATVAGVKYYSLSAAVKKASQLGGKETVKIIGDAALPTSTTFNGNGITAVIDGNGHTLSSEGGNTIFKISGNNYKLTFKNMTINHGGYDRLLQYEAKKENIDVTWENVKVVATGTSEDACYKYGLMNLRGSGSFTMKSSSITYDVPKIIKGAGAGVIRTGNANDGQKLNIRLENSKIDVSKTKDAYGIYVQKGATTNIVLKKYEIHTNNKYPIYVHADDGDAKLTYDNMNTWSSKSPTVNWLCNLLSLMDIEDAAKIGNKSYRTLAEAFEAAQKAGGNVTITLKRDCILSARTTFKTANSSITIDGAGKYKLTTRGGEQIFNLNNDNVSLTFKNLVIDHQGYDRFLTSHKKSEGVYTGVNVAFDNVTMNASGTSDDKCYPYGLFNLRATGAFTMINNSTITLDVEKVFGGSGYGVLRLGNPDDGQTVKITMNNSTIDASKTENIAGINVSNGATAEVEISNSTLKTNNKYAINVNSTGKLTLAKTDTEWSSVDTTIKSITNCKTMVDNVCYQTFTEAWNVAKESGKATTITLLNDCTVTKAMDEIKISGTEVTIDGEGNYILTTTANAQMFMLGADDVALTFKDLVIKHQGNDRFITSKIKDETVTPKLLFTGVNIVFDNAKMTASGNANNKCYPYGLFNLRATGAFTMINNSTITLDVEKTTGGSDCGVIRLGNSNDGHTVKITMENSAIDASKTENIAGINVSNGATAEVKTLNSTIKAKNRYAINVNSTGGLILAQSEPEWSYENVISLTNCEATIGDYYGQFAGVWNEANSRENATTITLIKDCTLDKTFEIADGHEIALTNANNVNVTITREAASNMFNIGVGAKLTIGTADSEKKITIDGANLSGTSLINNAGTFITNNNVTIQNVNAGDNVGGVLYNTGTATLNGTMTGNTASQGAIAYNKGTVTIETGTYSHNIAKKNSGVIYSDSASANVEIKGGVFEYNEAQTATGGVLAGKATTTITGGTFQHNKAANGASVLNVAGSCTATISNATITDNELVKTSTSIYNGAIYVSGSGNLTLENCNISGNSGIYNSTTNPGCDISIGGNVTLSLKNNINVGSINKRETTGSIKFLEEYTGAIMVIPPKNHYTIGSPIVVFDNAMSATAKENTAEKIIVREYSSATDHTDERYCVDTAGLLQYNHPAQVGTVTYQSLAEAIAAAKTGDTVYVLKNIALGNTITIGSGEEAKELTITNIAGVDVTVTRTTTSNMFDIKAGSKLTIGTVDSEKKITIDGADLSGTSLINNAGTFVANNNVTIQNVNAGTNVGGVLYNTGTATLNGTMTGNTANRGAVVYNTGAVTLNGTMTGNVASDQGGVVYSSKGTVTIEAGTYSNNRAVNNGGVIYTDTGAIVNINGGTFESNEAVNKTGGVAGGNATTTIAGGTFRNNKAANGASVLNVAGSCNATISNATITGNSLVRVGTGTVYNGAIYVSGSGKLTLEKCNISGNSGLYNSTTNPGCDISIGGNVTLSLKNNTNVGLINKRETTGSIKFLEEYTGAIVVIPPKTHYTTSSKIVVFDNAMSATAKENTVAKIIVREYSSATKYTDNKYSVGTDGLLKLK